MSSDKNNPIYFDTRAYKRFAFKGVADASHIPLRHPFYTSMIDD
jgi:hypothetical protein